MKIYYIMGKSAAGKDFFYQELRKDPELELTPLVIFTTRPMRSTEEEGREYHFVTEERLRELRGAGKVIEERTYQTECGPWTYFTVDDGTIDAVKHDYLAMGTLESYEKIREYFGQDKVVPVYIEVEDGERLERAIRRERGQMHPQYAEVCRRFLADTEDFSDERLEEVGIWRRFDNSGEPEKCMQEIREMIHGLRAMNLQ